MRSTRSTPSRSPGTRTCCSNSSRAAPETLKGLPPNYELTWNHTTLRALRVDPSITYLQVRYGDGPALERAHRIHDKYRDEMIGHFEFIRFNGRIEFAGLPLRALHHRGAARRDHPRP